MRFLKPPPVLIMVFFLLTHISQAQDYPLQTIEEIQFVLNPQTDDQSFSLGDTIEVRGIVMSDVRGLVPNSSWSCFIVDPTFPTDPWQGLLIVQNDTTVSATQFGNISAGMICRFTGIVQEIETVTQLSLLTDPAIQVSIESVGAILPVPIELGTDELTNKTNGEQWEGQLVHIADATITNNSVSSNRAIIEDDSELPTFIDDQFRFFNRMFENATYNWPANGSTVEVTGFVQGLSDGYSVNPRDFNDFIAISTAPVISDVIRNPLVPNPDNNVLVTATITDNNSVASATLHYSLDWGAWNVVAMNSNESEWSAEIPKQDDESFLRYFVSAKDNEDFEAQFPADTSKATGTIFRYVIRKSGLPIADVQNTYGYGNDVSGYNTYNIILEGVVMSGPEHFAGYYIQDAAAAWSGIFVRGISTTYQIGDWIKVSGKVEEDFGLTKVLASSSELITEGFGVFEPMPQKTGDLATHGALSEAFESVLVSFNNVTVTDIAPDGQNNFGEFIIDDGSGGLRVDDESEQYEGNLGNEIELGSIGSIKGIHFYSFSEFKLAPRDNNDTDLVLGLSKHDVIRAGFSLKQNYPNPFNPITIINYDITNRNYTSLIVYNLLGKEVTTLISKKQNPGSYRVEWDATELPSGVYIYTLRSGDYIETKKMVLLK
ncbi:MAG: T9SS C-terminal target domain-containing protein [Calditrichaeota bacterium]|nr:MAG: T9SS C-terminal target domain-containing protein [Calditrichota bacterium]MBL1203942.1 T9SS C-terminal target domain-containing protein [Calditrichota bacterium]NOG43773.1 T9SS type A sorting domain-containing protein [Calditrichota bacterium]